MPRMELCYDGFELSSFLSIIFDGFSSSIWDRLEGLSSS